MDCPCAPLLDTQHRELTLNPTAQGNQSSPEGMEPNPCVFLKPPLHVCLLSRGEGAASIFPSYGLFQFHSSTPVEKRIFPLNLQSPKYLYQQLNIQKLFGEKPN